MSEDDLTDAVILEGDRSLICEGFFFYLSTSEMTQNSSGPNSFHLSVLSVCPSCISRTAELIYFTLSSGSASVSECSLAWRRSSRFCKVTAWFWWWNAESRPGGTARPLKPIWGCNCRPEYTASPPDHHHHLPSELLHTVTYL